MESILNLKILQMIIAYPDKEDQSSKEQNEEQETFYEQNSDDKKYPDEYLRTEEPQAEPENTEDYLRTEVPENEANQNKGEHSH